MKVLQPTLKLNSFKGRALPEPDCLLTGYAWLIHTFDLHVLLPRTLVVIGTRNLKYEKDQWLVLPNLLKFREDVVSQLTFALKYEGVNLWVLRALFLVIDKSLLEDWVTSEPTGRYSRRIWFLYEWLTDEVLELADISLGNYVDVLDDSMQFTGPAIVSNRHRVRNNLTGTKAYCPLVWKTDKLANFLQLHLNVQARELTGSLHPDVLGRAAAFLLLQDSKASFAIEGERPARNRAERWGKAIGQAGLYSLSIEELNRLQTIVIEDPRFIQMGLRLEGGFIGVHERETGLPLPDHISAKWQDVVFLTQGIIHSYDNLLGSDLDPVVLAGMLAFGFVFIHPYEDGNGRLHRYLIHHVLTTSGFSQPGMIFPISTAILRNIGKYRQVLEEFSRPRLEFIDWVPTAKGNVDVQNETVDLYRYFDATPQVEFLYECVLETVQQILPAEIHYLKCYDLMKSAIHERFDMPDHLIDLLIRFLDQNKGTLSNRVLEKEFNGLTPEEVFYLETRFAEIFLS